jgi:hypothetical protein
VREKIVADLAQWCGVETPGPRLITFFGLVPNFAPSQLAPIWRAALRPGDWLLASVHLEGEGMEVIRPQYDNSETLAWLNEALVAAGVARKFPPPEMVSGEMEGVPAFLGRAGSLQLFHSLRYTPESFTVMAKKLGFVAEQLAITPCGQEAIWLIRLP